jgi:hypothetical protein
MAEIPNLPEARSADDTEHSDLSPGRIAEWLVQHQESLTNNAEANRTPPAREAPLTYELNISPSLTATVELKEKTEADFDRRHEVLDEGRQQEPSLKGMVPLGQILASYPAQRNLDRGFSNTPSSQAKPTRRKEFFAKPLYRRALVLGTVTGVISGCTALAWLIFISR